MDAVYFPQIDPLAIARHLDEWRRQYPQAGILALLPEAESAHVGLVQEIFRDRSCPLRGAIFPALLSDTGFTTQGVILICFRQAPPATLLPLAGLTPATAAAHIAAALPLPAANAAPATLFMIFDGLLPNIASILFQLFERAKHRCRFSGVNAGSERFQPMPCLFDGERCVGEGVMALLLPEDVGQALAHGYPTTRSLRRATTSTRNRVEQIDGQPAFTAYQQLMQEEFGIALTHDNFYQLAVHHPFGLVSTLDVLVRIPVAFTADGALDFIGEIPANSLLRLLRAPALDESTCIDRLARALGEVHGPSLVAFYCAGRRMHFGEAAAEEIQRLHRRMGLPHVLGALSLGEISTDNSIGLPEFHNAAVLCLN